MTLLRDTHALPWWLADPKLLSEDARRAIGDGKNTVYVSAAVAWEIAVERALGKLKDGAFSREVLEKGRTRTISGRAGFENDTLALVEPDGPPLVGEVTRAGSSLVFAPPGDSDKAPVPTSTRRSGPL